MGLLDRAIALNNFNASAASQSVEALVTDFHRKNPLFHCILLRGAVQPVADMLGNHGTVCAGLSGTRCLVLLPGALDRELYAHRLSRSAAQAVLCQTSVNSPILAIETLRPYLR